MEYLNMTIVVLYLVAMLGFGWWGKSRTRNASDYLVAGRRLGPLLYTGTMAAVVLGGASTVGGVGLGYTYGISGMWLVVAIGAGVLLLSLLFAPTIQRLKIYTVSQMLTLRYGSEATKVSGIVMLAYTLMLCATSTGAYATIFVVLFGWDRALSIAIGGIIVVIYSAIGGMWSITLADMAQFIIKTIGVFALMLPFALSSAGGFSGIADRAGAEFFDITGIGAQSIITYFVVYTLGLLIGQDIWQRVFTSKTPGVARWGGATAGIYCILYGVAGAVIGMAASVILPDIESRDDVYADIAINVLPVGIGGLVLAAAVAAMMSTASGALIAAATVARADVLPYVRSLSRRNAAQPVSAGAADGPTAAQAEGHDVTASRWWVFGLGVTAIALAIVVQDVVAALTIAYDILVGGLLVSIIGGLVWKRGNGLGAGVSMAVGTLVTLGTMIYLEVNAENQYDGIYANEPIYYGLGASAAAYIAVSLASPPTPVDVRAAWEDRVAGNVPEDSPAGARTEAARGGSRSGGAAGH